jgi:hypothetical protein
MSCLGMEMPKSSEANPSDPKVMLEIARNRIAQGKRNSLGIGLSWAEKAVEAAKEADDIELEVEGLYMCARISHELGDIERRNAAAKECLLRELEIKRRRS